MSSASITNGDISTSQQIVASSVGALLTSLLATPMDVVKTRLQRQAKPLKPNECFLFSNGLMDHVCRNCADTTKTALTSTRCEWYNRPGHFNGTADAFVKVVRNEGLLSLWSGLTPTMVSAIPATVFYFTAYDNILHSLKNRLGDRVYVPLIAGSIARTMAVTVVSPLELLRTKMQSERHTYKQLKHAVKTTIAFDGYSALWRGWSATLLREIPFSGVYWTFYELFKHKAVKALHQEKTNFTISFLCGASSGVIAGVVTMPFDVVKTQQQITLGEIEASQRVAAAAVENGGKAVVTNSVKGKSVVKLLAEIAQTKGLGALYTGLVPRLARIVPSCGIMISTYEHLKLLFRRRNNKAGI